MKQKASDYIIDFLIAKGIDTVFSVSGGASAHLLNSVNQRRDKLKYVNCYNEQACAMAADAYARIAGKPACVLVTNGPGSTNAITGVLGAYQDSIPMIVLSGQVPHKQSITSLEQGKHLRQLGVQECDIVSIATSITNWASQVFSETLKDELNEAWDKGNIGRKGPVWIDVPLDVQASIIDTETKDYPPITSEIKLNLVPYKLNDLMNDYNISSRAWSKPLIIAGNGIHLSKSENKFKTLIKLLSWPVVTTWNAKDLFEHNDPQFIGSFGLLGDRAANKAIQEAELLLILGSRLSIPNIGYNTKEFSPNSIKIMVDIDMQELTKPTLNIDFKINDNLSNFIDKAIFNIGRKYTKHYATTFGNFTQLCDWKKKLVEWKEKYPTYKEEYSKGKQLNSYYFIEQLGKHLKDNHIIVTDMGTAFTCTMQSMKMNGKARLFTSSGTCSMGFGLPGAIGAWFADPTKEIILIAGDGGFQMNIQELQTIKHYNIPIKIFILNNNGYSAISLMQDNLFNGEYIGSTSKDISSPDFTEIFRAYMCLTYHSPYKAERRSKPGVNFERALTDFMNNGKTSLMQLDIIENQPILPRVQSKKDENGNIVSTTLDNMYPFEDDK